MSQQPSNRSSTTDRHGGTESKGAKGAATTALALGVLGVIAGVLAINDLYPVLMGIAALVLGVIAVIAGVGAWKRAKDTTGEIAGTPGTNLALAGRGCPGRRGTSVGDLRVLGHRRFSLRHAG